MTEALQALYIVYCSNGFIIIKQVPQSDIALRHLLIEKPDISLLYDFVLTLLILIRDHDQNSIFS